MRSCRRDAGFTLIELLVSLLILSIVIVGVLTMFDSTNHLAKNQIQRVNLQQSLRVAQNEMVRMVRLAGRGGLPLTSAAAPLPDQGWALSVDTNVVNRKIINDAAAPDVLDGSDILTIRGVFTTPVFLVDLEAPAYNLDTTNQTGTLVIQNTTPIGGQPQDLEALCDMLTGGANRPEALILVSAYDDRLFGTVQINYNNSISAGCPNPTSVTLGFTYTGTTYTARYATLSSDGRIPGVFPVARMDDTEIGTVGILEEYRFYLRQGRQMDTANLGDNIFKLSRARTYPNVDEAYDGDVENLRIDVAENMIDFQVAFAFDGNDDGLITESLDGSADEWLFNSIGEVATDNPWPILLPDAAQNLYYLRLSTLARTFESDRSSLESPISRLEDNDYSTLPPFDPLAITNHPLVDTRYPRIVLRTNVEMRNL